MRKIEVYRAIGGPGWMAHCRNCGRVRYYRRHDSAFQYADLHARKSMCTWEARRQQLLLSCASYRLLDSLLEQWIGEVRQMRKL